MSTIDKNDVERAVKKKVRKFKKWFKKKGYKAKFRAEIVKQIGLLHVDDIAEWCEEELKLSPAAAKQMAPQMIKFLEWLNDRVF